MLTKLIKRLEFNLGLLKKTTYHMSLLLVLVI